MLPTSERKTKGETMPARNAAKKTEPVTPAQEAPQVTWLLKG